MEEDIKQHSFQHNFLAASLVNLHLLDLSSWDEPFCDLDTFLTCETSIPFLSLAASEPFHAIHGLCAPCALCHNSLFTPTNGLECFAWSCWQRPNKCHMQLSSGNALHRGGSNHLHVSTQFEAPGAEWFEPYATRDAKAFESVAQVKALQAHHGVCYAFLT